LASIIFSFGFLRRVVNTPVSSKIYFELSVLVIVVSIIVICKFVCISGRGNIRPNSFSRLGF
jgi:hypothetical protein